MWQRVIGLLDWMARVHFVGTMLWGVGGWAVTFFSTAASGWDASSVWIASIFVGACCAIIYIAFKLNRFAPQPPERPVSIKPMTVGTEATSTILKCFFHMNDPGCVCPNTLLSRPKRTKGLPRQHSSAVVTGGIATTLTRTTATTLTPTGGMYKTAVPSSETLGTYYRVKASAEGSHIFNCKGRLEWMKRGSLTLIGEPVWLPFAPSESADFDSKTVHVGAPEHLDFLFISNDDKAELTPVDFMGPSSIPWQTLFAATGDYTMQIKILSSAATASINLLFRWTGDRKTSEIIQTG
jgi:hypothetical protein